MSHFRRAALVVVAMLVAAPAFSADNLSENDKVFYFLGTALSGNVKPLNLSGDEIALVTRGMADALNGTAIELDEAVYGPKLNEIASERMAENALREEGAAQTYIEKMAAEDGAITTNSGIVYLELVAGDGVSPTPDSTVTANYEGKLRDGTVFDSSIERGQPFTAPLSGVIPCWREAIPMMKVGGKARITCPADLAYGERGSGSIPGGAALTFEVELLDVVE